MSAYIKSFKKHNEAIPTDDKSLPLSTSNMPKGTLLSLLGAQAVPEKTCKLFCRGEDNLFLDNSIGKPLQFP